MKLFELHRRPKTSGVAFSVATLVAEGMEFSDGTVVVRFASPSPHTCLYESMAGVALIGALEPLTVRCVWEPPARPPPMPRKPPLK